MFSRSFKRFICILGFSLLFGVSVWAGEKIREDFSQWYLCEMMFGLGSDKSGCLDHMSSLIERRVNEVGVEAVIERLEYIDRQIYWMKWIFIAFYSLVFVVCFFLGRRALKRLNVQV